MHTQNERPTAISPQQRHIELEHYDADQRVIAGVEQLRFFPLVVERGEGCRLITPSGRELIDFSASWTASSLGHAHPVAVAALVEAAQHQAGASVLSAATTTTTAFAARLAERVPVRDEEASVYLGLAGTDANDVALRAALALTGRNEIVTFAGSYHGGLGLAQDVSGFDADANETAAGRHLLPFPTSAAEAESVLEELATILSSERVAVVLTEAIQCDGGVVVPADGFLRGLREACDRHGTLLMIDEVKAGLGRTGRMFAFEHEEVVPDIVTLGKSLGAGLPVSAAIGRSELFAEPAASALLTTAGSPAACAAAHAAFELLSDATLHQTVTDLGRRFGDFVAEYRASGRPGATHLAQVRGRGLLRGLEIVDATGAADAALAAKTVYRAWELGCVAYVVRGNVIECTPPLLISADELAAGLSRIVAALDDAVVGLVDDEVLEQFAGW